MPNYEEEIQELRLELNNVERANAETVRRIQDCEADNNDMRKDINGVKLDINSLKVRVGIYSALGALVGGALVTIIVTLILASMKK